MKKINTDVLEKMAKNKNIDKDKVEKIADSYKGKSENELIDELVKIGKTLEGRDEVVSKFKAFLDDDQRKKLDLIMNKISDAEVQSKIDSKKSKSKKGLQHKDVSPSDKSTEKSSKKSKSSKNSNSTKKKTSPTENNSDNSSHKKVKKVVKKVKKPN